MKKLLLLTVLFIIPYYLFAQFSVGFKITPFFCNFNRPFGNIGNDLTVETGYIGVWNFGGFVNYKFNGPFALQAEVNYRYEGLNYSDKDQFVNDTFGQKIIEIPLLFQIKGKSRFHGFAEAGISLKCLTSATHYIQNNEYNVNEYFNLFRLSGKIGGGGVLNIWNNLSLLGNFRLGYDFTPIGKSIYDERTSENWTFNEIRYFDWNIFLGIMYTFNK